MLNISLSSLHPRPLSFWSIPLCVVCVWERERGKMPIEMLKGLPFSVDTWSTKSSTKRYHFLTHAHKDHTQGICTYASYPIYCSHLTKTLVLQHYPQVPFDFQLFRSCYQFWWIVFELLIICQICLKMLKSYLFWTAWWINFCGYWGWAMFGDQGFWWWFHGYCLWCQSLPRCVLRTYEYAVGPFFFFFRFFIVIFVFQ